MDLTDDNYDDIVGHKKYALVEFYTKWCRFCQMLAPEYDKLVDIMNNTRKDIVIGRLESGSNDVTSSKYGINQYPILALFNPGSKRIVNIYQGERRGEHMANWLNQNCPKIEIKEDFDNKKNNKKNNNEESLQIEMENINEKNELTLKSEYIKENFFDLKKRLDDIDKKIENSINLNIKKKSMNNFKKIRIIFDFSFINIFVTGITLLIIFAFYKTGRKLLINLRYHEN